MALTTRVYDSVNYMTETEDVFHRLDAEFELYEPEYLLGGLQDAIRARGGAARMASESGIPECELTNLDIDDDSIRNLATRLMEAYRPAASSTKVA